MSSVAHSSPSAGSATPASSRGVWFLIFLLLAYPAWIRGGTYRPAQEPILWIGIALLLWMIAGTALGNPRHWMIELGRSGRRLFRDPVFWLGAAFTALITIQWMNSGRHLVPGEGPGPGHPASPWSYSPSPHPSLPSSFSREDARQMLVWFIPAWALCLALRSPDIHRHSIRRVAYALILNAACVAGFGIVQFLSGTDRMYWILPARDTFFAGFGYANHAGSFFLLMLALSIGLLQRHLLASLTRLELRTWILIVAAVLELVAVALSLSRLAVLLALALIVLTPLHFLARTWATLNPVVRVNFLAGTVAILGMAVLLAGSAGSHTLQAEILSLASGNPVTALPGDRRTLAETALRVWKDHFWFGTGGWGFGYLLALYLPSTQWDLVAPGRANVHNDALQFLSEFGLVGATLLALAVLIMAFPLIRRSSYREPTQFALVCGLALIAIHSLVDLPFRCPAVLLAWLLVLNLSARSAAHHHAE